MRLDLVKAVNISKSKHKGCKCLLAGDNEIVMSFKSKEFDGRVHVYTKIEDTDDSDKIIQVLEDLRKDLIR